MVDQASYETLSREVAALKAQSERLLAAEGAVQRNNEYLTALHETALGLIDKLDTQELLQTILERAVALARTRHGYIYLCGPDDSYMEIRVGMGFFSGQLGRRVSCGEGMGGKVWQAGRPLVVDDYQRWPDRLPDDSLDRLHCIVGIPLKFDQRIRGVIGLGHVDPDRHFDQEAVQLLERFAALALLALEKAELYMKVRRELGERQKAEARIRESEQRYRNFLESSRTRLWSTTWRGSPHTPIPPSRGPSACRGRRYWARGSISSHPRRGRRHVPPSTPCSTVRRSSCSRPGV